MPELNAWGTLKRTEIVVATIPVHYRTLAEWVNTSSCFLQVKCLWHIINVGSGMRWKKFSPIFAFFKSCIVS
jgi:hypothetical protein